MIHPHDHVLAVVTARRDRDGAIARVEQDQRAGCVEADAAHGIAARASFSKSDSYCLGARAPNVVRRLFDEIRCGLPGLDRVHPHAEPLAGAVEQAGTCAAGTDVDAQVKAAHLSAKTRTL